MEDDCKVFCKSWQLGLLLIIVFSVIGELLVVFDEYVFFRLGVDRNIVFIFLWIAPLLAAYIATRYSPQYKVLMGLSFLPLYPAIGATAHYINGELGGVVDFVGASGAIVVFKVNLAIGSVLVIIGTIIGLALSKRR